MLEFGEGLKKRFREADLFTRIMVLDPNYRHIDVVADMDPEKKGRPELQRKNCELAIAIMNRIKTELGQDGITIDDRVQFISYRVVPTWTGFLGDNLSYIGFYFARPYRGNLNFVVVKRHNPGLDPSTFHGGFEVDFDDLWRISEDEGSRSLFR